MKMEHFCIIIKKTEKPLTIKGLGKKVIMVTVKLNLVIGKT